MPIGTMTRRTALLSAAAMFGTAAFPRVGFSEETKTIEAKTTHGRVAGRSEGGIAKFLGIPYGAPPIGALRFKAPVAPEAWSGVRDALEFGNPSFQVAGGEMGPNGNGRMPAPSEDCLYLNVWTPAADGKRRPVMFYNHGGGYMIGSGAATGQDGTNLARLYDVVVVQSNHRLGLLGYLFLGDLAEGEYTANAGMLDIQAALRWTRDNIENFGGDPDNIMVWGESGGGSKTAAIYTMPGAASLFHKASIESAAPLRFPTREQATERARETLKWLGLAETDIGQLQDIPAARLLEAQEAGNARGLAPWGDPDPVPGFGSFVDGTVITQNPFADGVADFSRNKPLICGTTRDETVFFASFGPKDVFDMDDAALRERLSGTYQGEQLDDLVNTFKASRPDASPSQIYFAITTSAIWKDSVKIAEAKVKQGGAPVFMYHLAYQSPVTIPETDYPIGSPHAADINIKFANTDKNLDFYMYSDTSPERQATASHMSALWAGFARTGVPQAEGVVEWPAYDLETRPTMWIDAECRIENDLDAEVRKVWDR
ncbi:para-nitrobenzyl esterase [Devosia sp. Root685]|uniref:carboxylesterase/lipase family protein n=1 Tax=Devosia sp. Root685 TaxID=1736587 RepID=UPI0006F3B080|nr:carboxylesterase family protein [Devosia sp. Root685]KRA98022.1 para-nitrobenzyl esterase [Devosia sp. Root685]